MRCTARPSPPPQEGYRIERRMGGHFVVQSALVLGNDETDVPKDAVPDDGRSLRVEAQHVRGIVDSEVEAGHV